MDPSKHRGLSLAFPGCISRPFPQHLRARMHSPVALTLSGSNGRRQSGQTEQKPLLTTPVPFPPHVVTAQHLLLIKMADPPGPGTGFGITDGARASVLCSYL